MTAPRAEAWLAALHEQQPLLASGTIQTYKAALHTRWEESGVAGDNPWSSQRIRRMMIGIRRTRTSVAAARTISHPPSFEVTPPMLTRIAPCYDTGYGDDAMQFAAITMGVGAMLRPGELLGSRDRAALLVSAVTFYNVDGTVVKGSYGDDDSPPLRYTINLGPTKADQLGRNPPSIITNLIAVQSMWRWYRRKLAGDGDDSPLFAHNGDSLTIQRLLVRLSSALDTAGIVHGRLTGRCFRRGGASYHYGAGSSIATITLQGRWRSQRMIRVYASTESKVARAALIGANLIPTDAAQSAAASGLPPRRK